MDCSLLLVEEDEQFLKTLSRRLETAGFKVQTAEDVHEALEFALRHKVGLVILGAASHEKDALDVLRQIKLAKPGIEVIMLTGQGAVETSMQAMKLGAYDCLQKPISIEDLVEKIKEVQKKKAVRRKP
jgi:DNA-binding NtrC family response regulator